MGKVLITGGCTGIGKAFTKKILECTQKSLILVKNKSELPSELQTTYNERIKILEKDLSSFQAGVELYDQSYTSTQDIESIVFSHGINSPGPIDEDDEEEFRKIMSTNLESIYGFASKLKLNDKNLRSIVCVSSFCGHVGGPTTAHYAISKSGVDTLCLNLARRFGSSGVRVNSIAPGYVKTRMINGDIDNETKNKVMLGRAAEPYEIAEVISFLTSEASSYITGQCIRVDGGLRI